MPRRFWTCSIITTISALVSAGFSVVGLLAPSSSDSFARYAVSRSIALLIAVLFCLGVCSREGIAALALVMSLVQGFDGIIGILAHDPAKTYGPFVFCPRELRWACVAAAPTERVGEKVFYGQHLFAAKPEVNSAPNSLAT
jgi:hypothetical protein